MHSIGLEERLRGLPIESQQLLARAHNSRIRLREARESASKEQMLLLALVKALRHRGVPAKTIALALGMSKTWVIRFAR